MQEPASSQGDVAARDHLAQYILQHQARIRAMARQKLTARARSWTDSEDVVGSVYCKLDGLLRDGRLQFESFDDLWPLIQVIAERRAIDRNRLASNVERLLGDEVDHVAIAQSIRVRPEEEVEELMLRVLARVGSGLDRQILMLMLRGTRARVAGDLLGLSEEATRQRWSRIRKDLLEALRDEQNDRA